MNFENFYSSKKTEGGCTGSKWNEVDLPHEILIVSKNKNDVVNIEETLKFDKKKIISIIYNIYIHIKRNNSWIFILDYFYSLTFNKF